MAISSTNRVAGPFTGSGTTATFPFTFKVFEAADLEVVTQAVASGAIAKLALTTDYTVALNADQDTSPGGSITLTAGNLATGMTLTITTATAQLQGLDLTNGGGFYPDVINAALDLLTILVQQLQVQQNQAMQAPFGDNTSLMLPAAALRAGKLLMFDAGGNPDLVDIATGGIVLGAPQTAAPAVDGTTTAFTFTAAAGSTPAILVFAGGVLQDGSADYGGPVYVSGTTWQITFIAAPVNGPIKVLMLG